MTPSESERTEISPKLLGYRLVQWAAEIASESVADQLQDQEIGIPLRKGEEVFWLELIIFCLFPVDAVVQKQFGYGGKATVVRRAMRDHLRERAEGDPALAAPEGLDELIVRRFDEYNAEYGFDRDAGSAEARRDNLRRMTWTAYQNMTGDEQVDPRVTGLLFLSFVGTMKYLAPALSRYKLVSANEASFEAKIAGRGLHAFTEGVSPEEFAAAEAERHEIPTCSTCGKWLTQRPGEWSWEWVFADYLSSDHECWSCTTPLRRGVVLSALVVIPASSLKAAGGARAHASRGVE